MDEKVQTVSGSPAGLRECRVIRVVIEPPEDDRGGIAERVDVVVTREQLRSLAWATRTPLMTATLP